MLNRFGEIGGSSPKTYRGCVIVPGMAPFCQPSGEFHGRSEIFSGSVVAQPPAKPIPITSKRSRAQWLRMNRGTFIPSLLIQNLIAFHDIRELPSRQNIGDAAVSLDALDPYLGDELAIAVHEHLPLR